MVEPHTIKEENRQPLSLKFLDLRFTKIPFGDTSKVIYKYVIVLLWKGNFSEKKLENKTNKPLEYMPEYEKKRLIPLKGANPLHINIATKK